MQTLVVGDKESKLITLLTLLLLLVLVDSLVSSTSVFLLSFHFLPTWPWSILEAREAINSLPENLWLLHHFPPATAPDLSFGIKSFPTLTFQVLDGRELRLRPFQSSLEKTHPLRPRQHHRHSTAIL